MNMVNCGLAQLYACHCYREKLEDDAEFEVIGDINKLQEDAEKATEEHAKAEAAGSENGAEKEGNNDTKLSVHVSSVADLRGWPLPQG